MKLRDLLCRMTSNPDLVGIVKLTADEIDPAALQRHQKKVHRARAYLRLRKLDVQPLYQTKE